MGANMGPMAPTKKPADMSIHEWIEWHDSLPEIKAMHEAMAKAEDD